MDENGVNKSEECKSNNCNLPQTKLKEEAEVVENRSEEEKKVCEKKEVNCEENEGTVKKNENKTNLNTSGSALSSSDYESACWYFQSSFVEGENTSIAGPFTPSQLQQYYQLGYIDGLSLVWCNGMTEWLPLSSCDSIKSYLLVQEDEEENEDEEKEKEENFFLTNIPSTHTYVTPEGIQFIFDIKDGKWKTFKEYKNEMAEIQLNDSVQEYSSDINEEKIKKNEKVEKRKKYRERRKQRKAAGQWLSVNKNPNVYVSGLPPDVTEEELETLFKRAGVIKIDPNTMKSKIRLYRESTGEIKGDCLISFVHQVSVDMAIRYLDEYRIRPDCIIHVEQAEFREPSKATTESSNLMINQKDRHKKLLAAKLEQKRLLDWGEDVDDGSGRRIVILKPMFSRQEAETYEEGEDFYDELKQEIFDELSTYALIEKVTPIARHPQGIVCVRFKRPEEAEAAIAQFQGRFFAGRQVEAYFFDKKTDLKAQCIPSKKLSSINSDLEDLLKFEQEKFAENEVEEEGKETIGITNKYSKNLTHEVHKDEKNVKGEQEKEKEEEEEEEEEELTKKKIKLDINEDKQTNISGDEKRLDEYANWLEEQSSDEEFEIKKED